MTRSTSSEHVDVKTNASADDELESIDPRHTQLPGFHVKVQPTEGSFHDDGERPWFGRHRIIRKEPSAAVVASRTTLSGGQARLLRRNLGDGVMDAWLTVLPGNLAVESVRSVRTR